MKEFNELNLIIAFVWLLALFQAGISVVNSFKTSPQLPDFSLTKPPKIEEIYFSNNSEQKKRAQEIRKAYDRRITRIKDKISENRRKLDLR